MFSFFNRFLPQKTTSAIQLMSESQGGFYAWNGDLYRSDIVRSCIRPFAKAFGKLEPKHILEKDDDLKVNPQDYIRFLLEEPNPFMSGQVLQEKLATQLKLNNNAFACIFRDEWGLPVSMYPMPAVSVEALYDDNRALYLRFWLVNGKSTIFSYDDIVHLRQDFNANDIFGDSPRAALEPLMEVVNTTDQGIVKAIRNSSVIKWLLQARGGLNPEDQIKQAKIFEEAFLNVESGGGGVAITDNKVEAKQIDPKDYVPNASQMDKSTVRLYNFFGTNQNIVQNSYDENQWVAYAEGEIEPLGMQYGKELSRKLFTRKERAEGNKIILASADLEYASLSTKLNLFQMVDRGALAPNEWRRFMHLCPKKGGNELIRRLDYGTTGNEGA